MPTDLFWAGIVVPYGNFYLLSLVRRLIRLSLLPRPMTITFNFYRSSRMPCISPMCCDISFYRSYKRVSIGIGHVSGCCPAFILCLCIEPAFGYMELVLLDAVHRVQPQLAA